MMSATGSMFLIAAVSACATPSAPDLVVPLGSTCTHVAAVGAEAPHRAMPPPYEAQRLVAAVAEIASGSLDREHFSDMLEQLADSLVIVAPTQAADVDQIRRLAGELKQAHGTGQNPIRTALAATLHALQSAQPFYDYDRERFRHAVAMLAVALETVREDTPWQSPHDDEVLALQQAARAIYVAVGARPPFGAEATVGTR
jgi:hypothetical protein